MTVRKSKAKKRASRFPVSPRAKRLTVMDRVHLEAQLQIARARVAQLEGQTGALVHRHEIAERENDALRAIVLQSIAVMRHAEAMATARRRA